METWTAELVVDTQAVLGEGPCWDVRTGVLWWVDIMGQRLHRFNPATGVNDTYSFDEFVTVAVPRKSGGVVISFPHTIAVFDPEEGTLETLVDGIEGELDDNRFNDGKCDASGRLWIGTMSMSGKPNQGKLYCVDTDLSVHEHMADIDISNGMAWNADQTVMYYIDSSTRQVSAFDYDAASGEISNRRVAVQFGEDDHGVPDGMTVDMEGMIWVAQWGGAQVSRWDPSTGTKIGSIAVPAIQATSCMLGGTNLDEMYITTARIGMNEEQLAEYPLTGGLFRVKLNVSGAPVHVFEG